MTVISPMKLATAKDGTQAAWLEIGLAVRQSQRDVSAILPSRAVK